MDFDTFFGSPRWRILEIIAKKPSSPIEIAQQIETSVSYVSQQLKLLEFARIVKKQKTGKVDRGQPRNIYSLTNELLYLTILTKNLPGKKMIPLTMHHKSILAIWLLDNVSLHYPLEKLFWNIEEDLSEVEGLFVESGGIRPKVILFSESKKLKVKVENFFKKGFDNLEFVFLSKNLASKTNLKDFVPIIDFISNQNSKGEHNG